MLGSARSAAASAEAALLPSPDPALQTALEGLLESLDLRPLVSARRLAVSLLDLSEPECERYAGLNDRQTIYAASLPKIGVMLGAFEAIERGLLRHTAALESALERTIRLSSNNDASRLIQGVGFDLIARALQRYGLYDPAREGGLWVGKAYGPSGLRRHVEFWRAEPISGQWHAANSLQVARFFWLLDRGSLVSPAHSAAMKRILSNPGTAEYFVEGLRAVGVPLTSIFRKYGAYADTHCDAALVQHGGKRYVAVALLAGGPRGSEVLPRLIQGAHRLIVEGSGRVAD